MMCRYVDTDGVLTQVGGIWVYRHWGCTGTGRIYRCIDTDGERIQIDGISALRVYRHR